jgi:hypothetical protein
MPKIYAFILQVYASFAMFQLNKGIQKVWHYAALQWHTLTIKHQYQRITSASVVDG